MGACKPSGAGQDCAVYPRWSPYVWSVYDIELWPSLGLRHAAANGDRYRLCCFGGIQLCRSPPIHVSKYEDGELVAATLSCTARRKLGIWVSVRRRDHELAGDVRTFRKSHLWCGGYDTELCRYEIRGYVGHMDPLICRH